MFLTHHTNLLNCSARQSSSVKARCHATPVLAPAPRTDEVLWPHVGFHRGRWTSSSFDTICDYGCKNTTQVLKHWWPSSKGPWEGDTSPLKADIYKMGPTALSKGKLGFPFFKMKGERLFQKSSFLSSTGVWIAWVAGIQNCKNC